MSQNASIKASAQGPVEWFPCSLCKVDPILSPRQPEMDITGLKPLPLPCQAATQRHHSSCPAKCNTEPLPWKNQPVSYYFEKNAVNSQCYHPIQICIKRLIPSAPSHQPSNRSY